MKEEEKNQAWIKEYDCGWCGYVFQLRVRLSYGEKHNRVSTQVQCPRCKNFLNTWEDGKSLSAVKIAAQGMRAKNG